MVKCFVTSLCISCNITLLEDMEKSSREVLTCNKEAFLFRRLYDKDRIGSLKCKYDDESMCGKLIFSTELNLERFTSLVKDFCTNVKYIDLVCEISREELYEEIIKALVNDLEITNSYSRYRDPYNIIEFDSRELKLDIKGHNVRVKLHGSLTVINS